MEGSSDAMGQVLVCVSDCGHVLVSSGIDGGCRK